MASGSIEVLNSNNDQYVSFLLNIGEVDIQINRNPVVASLPRGTVAGGPEGNLPNAFTIDLGMMQEIIIISGTVNDVESKGDGYASIGQLLSIVRGGWFGVSPAGIGSSIGSTGGVGINIDMGQNEVNVLNVNGIQTTYGTVQRFQGCIQSFQAVRSGIQTPLNWSYKLTLIVTSWPTQGSTLGNHTSYGPMFARTRNDGPTSNDSSIGLP